MKTILNIIMCIALVCLMGCKRTVSVAGATLCETPETEPAATLAINGYEIGIAQAADGFVFAYADKDTSSRIIGSAVDGIRFAVTHQSDSWCTIIYDGETAFMPSAMLKIEPELTGLPQYTAYYVMPEREEIGSVYKSFNNKLVIKTASYKEKKSTKNRFDIYKTDGTLLLQDAALVISDGALSAANNMQDETKRGQLKVVVKKGEITKCENASQYTDGQFEPGKDTGKLLAANKTIIDFDQNVWQSVDAVVNEGTAYNATTTIDIEPSYYFEPKVLPDMLVDVRRYISDVKIDMVFAKAGNVLGDALYQREVCLLQKGTAEKLKAAQNKFAKDGYSIVIYDAYRPHSVTVAMYKKYKNTPYVASPKIGSDHNRGAAVDISLLDKNGKPVEMPSKVHTFNSTSHRNSAKMSRKARANMNYMAKVMKSCGFKTINCEWWHFSDSDALKYLRTDHNLNNIQRIIYE